MLKTTFVLALLGVLLLGALWRFQRRLIYFPSGPVEAGALPPGVDPVVLRTRDGLDLSAWFVPHRGEAAGTVLVCNGNAGDRSHRLPLARALSDQGFSVLLFDYRGYGGNTGDPTEAGLLQDALAARGYLEGRRDVDPSRLALFGESLGAAVALAAALERPPAALVLRSPFTSLVDVARHHYPFLPVALLLKDRFPSLDRIPRLSCPLLVIAGDQDFIIPEAQSRRLFEAAPEAGREFLRVPGAGHNDFELLAGPRLVREVSRFLRTAMDPAAPKRPPRP